MHVYLNLKCSKRYIEKYDYLYMDFLSWSTLENHEIHDTPTHICNLFADLIKKETHIKNVYLFPNFDKFTRTGEPLQVGYLLSTDELKTMRLNFVDENLWSIDIWNKGNKPALTVYVHNINMDRVISKVMFIYKNPTKVSLKENVDEIRVTSSKLENEGDSVLLNAQKKLEYEYSDPDVIFDDLATYVDMVINGAMNSLLLTGQSGVGKSFIVMEQLEGHGLKRNEDFFRITGKTSAAGLYTSLYENNDKMLIYDDCDSVFKDENAENVLKGALDTSRTREISWNVAAQLKTASKVSIPKKFDFTGKIIFISNVPRKKINSAIRSRAFMLEIALSKEDMLTRMWALLPTIELSTKIKISGSTKDKSMFLLTQAAEESEEVELNLRTLLKSIAIVSKVQSDDIALRMIKQQCSL